VRDYGTSSIWPTRMRRQSKTLANGDRGGAYNLGTGVGSTVREVLSAVERAVGQSRSAYGRAAPSGRSSLQAFADYGAAKIALGWSRRRTLDDAVTSAVVWGPHSGLLTPD
jgi:nucleoside-diphosphate-sugar epimerase